jgi:hypothetical protein
MVQRSSWSGLAALAALALGARPAAALAPCPDVCHLGQGQPLLLADADQFWVRRCATAKPGADEVCVLERVDLEGRVLERVPREKSYDEDAFEDAYLKGHKVVGLGHQSAWTDLAKPYKLEPYRAPGVTLRFDRDALVCASAKANAKAPAIRRPLGCTPKSVYVFAAGVGHDSKPEDPAGTAVVVATCADGPGTREAVAICRPPR